MDNVMMDNFEEIVENTSEEQLQELKAWLFRENIRLATAARELEEQKEQFARERAQFQEEMKTLSHKIASDRQRIKDDSLFFEKKMDILRSGFQQLDLDRRRLDKEWAKLSAQKELISERASYERRDVSVFFQGVRNPLALKKRYKDLIKIFHPDNLAGDKEVIQRINREYEDLKSEYESFKQA